LNNWHNAIIGHEFITYYLQDEAADQNEKNIAGSEIVKQSIFLVNIYSILFFKTLVSIVFEYLVSSLGFLGLDVGNENHIGVLVIILCHNSL
jgi:hypothetical protein